MNPSFVHPNDLHPDIDAKYQCSLQSDCTEEIVWARYIHASAAHVACGTKIAQLLNGIINHFQIRRVLARIQRTVNCWFVAPVVACATVIACYKLRLKSVPGCQVVKVQRRSGKKLVACCLFTIFLIQSRFFM
jgi:hypothetical protein